MRGQPSPSASSQQWCACELAATAAAHLRIASLLGDPQRSGKMRSRVHCLALFFAITAGAEDAPCDVPRDRWNDDYCDAPDGCDEPRTSACSTVAAVRRFECPDAGHGKVLLPASRVGDGVCDCCDGSDEVQGCGDVCEARRQAARAHAEEAEAAEAAGIDARKTMACAAKRGREAAKRQLAASEKDLDGMQAKIDAAREKRDAAKAEADALRDAAARLAMFAELKLDTLDAPALRGLAADLAREAQVGDALVRLARLANGLPEVEPEPEPVVEEAPADAEAVPEEGQEEDGEAAPAEAGGASDEAVPPAAADDAPPPPAAAAAEEAPFTHRLEDADGAYVQTLELEDGDGDDDRSEEGALDAAEAAADAEGDGGEADAADGAFAGFDAAEAAEADAFAWNGDEAFDDLEDYERDHAYDDYDDLLGDPDYDDRDGDDAGDDDRDGTFADLEDEEFPDDEYGDLPDDVFPDEYPPASMDDDDYGYHDDVGDAQLNVGTYHDADEAYLSSSKKHKLEALEEALGALERTRDDNEHTLRDAKAALGEADYGPDGARWALRGTCVEKTLQGYVYEVCFYKNARQGSTRLGDYRSTNGSTLTYDGGEHCWNGPARSVAVRLECGARTELVSVDEPRTCAYEARVRTPAVCGAAQEAGDECATPGTPLSRRVLDALGFG